MASFNAFDNNLIRDGLLVPILDCLTGFYAGFAIFTVLGHMFITKCVGSFSEVAAQGPELAFVVYPEGLALMGAAAPVFSVMFFIMMLALGFGSEFSIVESAISTTLDLLQDFVKTKRQIILTRICICLAFFLLGLTMVTRGGLFILNLIDSVIAGYPLLIVGLLEVIVIPWIYGTDRLVIDMERMLGKKPKWLWKICVISWKFISPCVLILVIISTFIIPAKELNLRGVVYPFYSKVIGWIIVAVPISSIFIIGLIQAFKHKFNWKTLLNPDDEYYAHYRKHLSKKNAVDFNKMSEIQTVDGLQNLGYLRETITELSVPPQPKIDADGTFYF
jgi:solute carrier family 6 amino acid transporter-like protein 5/7/9/14